MEILGIKDLTFTYRGAAAPTIKDVSFSLNAGEVLLLCGATGSGKSTLLRMLKRELTPLGKMQGSVVYKGKNIHSEEDPHLATKIGFVAQRPEGQIVTDKVWHELAFGLENMGVKKEVMARRIAEIANYFGIEKWFDRDVADLSGGEKQLLNLAAVMVMDPEVLILDEPTSQLDPIAASDFLATVRKLNADLSLSVIICEHRLEEIVPYADKLLAIDKGQVLAFDSPKAAFAKVRKCEAIMKNMPAASLVYERLTAEYKNSLNTDNAKVPFEIREGREFLQSGFAGPYTKIEEDAEREKSKTVLKATDLRFRYDRNEPDVLCGLNLSLYKNEILCLLGGNGSGKTTALKAAAGLIRPYAGKVEVFGRKLASYKADSLYKNCLAMLPQDVQTILYADSVKDELLESGIEAGSLPYDISYLLDRHPYDLSGGEQQLVALAKVLAAGPKILLLDEPTKGLDALYKEKIVTIIKDLKAAGVSVLIVTHDVEFAAGVADRCLMFFRGDVVSGGTPREFFSGNTFYTTAASRLSRGLFENAVTVDDVVKLAGLNYGKKQKN